MKILYGLAGEGMGHATRSRVVVEHLRRRGHTVKVAASGRACDVLRRAHPDVIEILGLELRYDDGAVDLAASLVHNARRMPSIIARASAANAAVDNFSPDGVFSDFDSFAHAYAVARGLPIVSVDNLQMIVRCSHDQDILGHLTADRGPAEAFVRAKLPGCNHYVVTTFFHPRVRPECVPTTTLVPPIIRDEVLKATHRDGDHILVYQTAVGDSRLLDTLQSFPRQKFFVYGLHRDAILGNCVLKKFSERGFVDDLASARAVVANGGMSLLGEAVYLAKPVYSVPVRKHFEQGMNAAYLAHLGYGATSDVFSADSLQRFMENIPKYSAALHAISRQDGNRELFLEIDRRVVAMTAR